MQFKFSNVYGQCELLYWHKPLKFNSCRTLLYRSGKCDKASMFIMIYFFLIYNLVCEDLFGWVWSVSVFGDVVVCLWMSLVFRVRADCLSEVWSCGVSPESTLLARLPVVVISNVWLLSVQLDLTFHLWFHPYLCLNLNWIVAILY